MMEHNGIPTQIPKPSTLPQEKAQYQFNGVHSSQSSRSSSPSMRPIPSSQLPPSRPVIPQSQLPPSRTHPDLGAMTQKIGQLSVSNPVTPSLSPKINSSTPSMPSGSQPQLFTATNISPVPKTFLGNLPTSSSHSAFSNVNNPGNVNHGSNVNIPGNVDSGSNEVNKASRVNSGSNVNNPGSSDNGSNVNITSNSNFAPMPISKSNFLPQPANVLSSRSNVNIPSNINFPPMPVGNSNFPPQPANVNSGSNVNIPSNINFPPMPVSNSNFPPQPGNVVNSGSNVNIPSNINFPSMPISNSNFPPQPGNVVNQQKPVNFQMQGFQPLNNQPNFGRPVNFPQNQPNLPTQPLVSNANFPPQYTASQNLPSPQPIQNITAMPPQNVTSQNGPVDINRANVHAHRYPNPPPQQFQQFAQPNTYPKQNIRQDTQQQYQSVATTGFSKYWGTENYDLLQNPNILPPTRIEPPKITLGNDILNEINCSPEVIRCTMTKIPENSSLLQKSRLPLGILIHPFKDLTHLNVVSCNVIVRCRACRTYINPFVYFVDQKRWKCNLCYRVNELPEEFMYDPYTKSYGDPSRRPEIKTSTIEYIAPAEYMLRPPQPAVYLYLLDISRLAVESGYLSMFCQILMDELGDIPGDARTQVGFIAYDSALHFFSLAEGMSQPHEMVVLEIDDVFLPTMENLLVNLKDRFELVTYLLQQLPRRYNDTFDNNSALGAALQVAYKLMGATGGRVTVFQCSLPNFGPGALTSREDPAQRASAEVSHLNPANDFYKRLALECSGQQIAVDLFVMNSQYVDVATVSGISKFSGGCVYHFPLFKIGKELQMEEFERSLRRYLTRKIGFEAVMRVRCTRGLAIHTFHGNFFVRSTDLLSLPNVNPDTGFGMQVSIEENLSDVQSVCFQAALLYTSSKGERRIRVHTVCLPVVGTVHDIIHSADQQAVVGLLAKMAVDRSSQSSLSDAREAFINVAVDILSSYKLTLNLGGPTAGLLAPNCLLLLPLYIAALLKHTAFKTGTSVRLDDRVKAMIDMKTTPLSQLIRKIYPDLYPIHSLEEQGVVLNSEEEAVPSPPRLQLTSRCLDNKGAFLLDTGDHMVILVCPNVSPTFLKDVLGVGDYNSITDQMYELPVLVNSSSERLHRFIEYLNDDRPFPATLQIIRDNSPLRMIFFGRLIEDRADNSLSYHEFLQHLKSQVK